MTFGYYLSAFISENNYRIVFGGDVMKRSFQETFSSVEWGSQPMLLHRPGVREDVGASGALPHGQIPDGQLPRLSAPCPGQGSIPASF